MDIKNKKLQVWLWLSMSLFLLVYFFDYLWSASVDLAHHYALVVQLTDSWRLPVVADVSVSNLGEMFGYPKLSHIFAVIFGIFLGSPLMGMQLVVLLSILTLWSAIGFALQSLPVKAFAVTALLFLILLLLNHLFVHVELFGSEIVNSYFFAQLAGQASMMAVMSWALFSERRNTNPWFRYVAIGIAILVIEAMHLLPALELFAFLALLIFLDFWFLSRPRNFKAIIVVGIFLAIEFIAILLHPAFKSMGRKIGGALPYHYIQGYWSLTLLGLMVVFLSILLLMRWKNLCVAEEKYNCLWLKYLGLFGLAVSGLCFAQMVALLVFNSGTRYACLKYGFGLNTLLFLDLAALPLIFSKSVWAPSNVENRALAQIFLLTFPAIFVACMFFTVLPTTKLLSLNWLVRIEKIMLPYHMMIMEKLPENKYDYVIGLKEYSTIDYLVSIGMLKDSRLDPNIASLLFQHNLSALEKVRSIFTLEGNKNWDFVACRQHVFQNSVVQIEGDCLQKQRKICTSMMDLSINGQLPLAVELKGFSSAFSLGRTSDNGADATFACDTSLDTSMHNMKVRIETIAMVFKGHSQRLLVSVNNAPPQTFLYEKNGEKKTIVLNMPITSSKQLKLHFSFPDAVSPAQLGLSVDNRKFSVVIRSIELMGADKPAVKAKSISN